MRKNNVYTEESICTLCEKSALTRERTFIFLSIGYIPKSSGKVLAKATREKIFAGTTATVFPPFVYIS